MVLWTRPWIVSWSSLTTATAAFAFRHLSLARPSIAALSSVATESWRMPGNVISSEGSNIGGTSTPNENYVFTVCPQCQGLGKRARPWTKKQRLRHKRSKTEGNESTASYQPQPRTYKPCDSCQSSGLQKTNTADAPPKPQQPFPHVAIVGGGLAGLALAAACRHRGIPHTVYERDANFHQRSQGYGLTLQQASRALSGFGITSQAQPQLPGGITSTRHVVHTADGTEVGEWGLRKWGKRQPSKTTNNDDECNSNSSNNPKKESTTKSSTEPPRQAPKRQNVHIARQNLRWQLYQAAGGAEAQVAWNHKLVGFTTTTDDDDDDDGKDGDDDGFKNNTKIRLEFQVGDDGNEDSQKIVTHTADLLVGADGIRSQVRSAWVGKRHPNDCLRYLGCLVILGICQTTDIIQELQKQQQQDVVDHPLLDGHTVFQTADGTTRLYAMPYSDTEYMWQLSFPSDLSTAQSVSRQGPQALHAEALARCRTWHAPVPDVIRATPVARVSGYPVYDRPMMTMEWLASPSPSDACVTLIGDACHPMSPFKGQGANQALLDALSLARALYQSCNNDNAKNDKDHFPSVLHDFHAEMLERTAPKVRASAEAAHFLHTSVAIQPGDVTRGAAAAASSNRASTLET